MPKMTIHREMTLSTHIFNPFVVYVDGEPQDARINNGGTQTYKVKPGEHEVEIAMGSLMSNTMVSEPFRITVVKGQKIKLIIQRTGFFLLRSAIWNIARDVADVRRMYRIVEG